MSTPEITEEHAGTFPASCTHCGAQLPGGHFCPGCGRPVAVESDVATVLETDVAAPAEPGDEPRDAQLPEPHSVDGHEPASLETEPAETQLSGPPPAFTTGLQEVREARTVTSPQPEPAPTLVARRGRRRMFIGLGAVAVGVAIAAGAAVALWPHGPDASVVYSQKVARVFGPVLGANRQVSNTLATLHGTRPANARLAVRRAQQQTTIAVGALGALSVPHGSEQLAGDARQVLDRENAYLSAVGAVLNHPRTASAGELQTLASNLTSSFSAAGPTVAGTSQTVSGANTLKAWVQRTREVLVHQARVKAEHKHAGTPATNAATASTGGGSAVTTNPYANGRDCGGGVYAGPNTSCSFAFNVREAYDSAPGLTASVQAYSPATGETYAMDCAPSGSGTTCSGANDASVTF